MSSQSKSPFEGRASYKGYKVDPTTDLCLVGLDTKHKSRAENVHWDRRILLPVDPMKVQSAYVHGIVKAISYVKIDCSRDERFGHWLGISNGLVPIVTDGRQRVRWVRAANVMRIDNGEPIHLVEARLMTGTEEQIHLKSRTANAVHEAPSPMDFAYELLDLRGRGYSNDSIRDTYPFTDDQIERYIRLLELSPKAQELLSIGAIKMSAANLLLEMTHAEGDAELQKLLDDGAKLTVEKVRAVTSSRRGRTTKADPDAVRGVTLKQIAKMATAVKQGEVEIDPVAAKTLAILTGKAAPSAVKGMTDLLRSIGYDV